MHRSVEVEERRSLVNTKRVYTIPTQSLEFFLDFCIAKLIIFREFGAECVRREVLVRVLFPEQHREQRDRGAVDDTLSEQLEVLVLHPVPLPEADVAVHIAPCALGIGRILDILDNPEHVAVHRLGIHFEADGGTGLEGVAVQNRLWDVFQRVFIFAANREVPVWAQEAYCIGSFADVTEAHARTAMILILFPCL